ncbi:MAG: hypothetical protein EBX81_02635 [bacterium]|nr:hypothetical protein [Candidatus Aquidulcis sp.]
MSMPREKLERQGVRALSDEELMAVMLGSGVQGFGQSTQRLLGELLHAPPLVLLCHGEILRRGG